MINCPKSALKSYEFGGLQQEGIMPSRRLGIGLVEPLHYTAIEANMMDRKEHYTNEPQEPLRYSSHP
jgi:hypothetical protein